MKENYVVFMTDKLPEFLNTDYLILKYDSDDTITMMILKKITVSFIQICTYWNSSFFPNLFLIHLNFILRILKYIDKYIYL